MNIFRTNAASYFQLDGTSSGSPTGGGSSGSPSAAPAAAGSPAPSSPAGQVGDGGTSSSASPGAGADSSADSFAGFDDDFDQIDLGDVAAVGTDPAAASTPGTEAAPAAPAPAAPVPPEQTPATTPAPAEAASPPPAGQAEPRTKVEAFLRDMTDESVALLGKHLATNNFALTEEEKTALDTDAVSIIPQLMGRVAAQTMRSAAAFIKNFVPEMVQQGVESYQARTSKSSEAMNEFYAANPELNSKDHGEKVTQWAKAFRAMNPKASRAEAIAFVGRAVKNEYNIQAGAAPQGRPAAPFVPARPGAVHQPITTQVDDPYAGLDQDHEG